MSSNTFCIRKKEGDTSSPAYHIKKVRRFFIACTMMFCINENYTIPIHILITDVIEGQWGSAMLIEILNRLGACASADTLARYIQHKYSNQKSTMDQWLNQDSFTVVSVDNIDFLHSYARVYKGSTGKTSFHGTSIQLVQPLPSLSEQLDIDVLTDVSNEPVSMLCTELSPEPQHLTMTISPIAKRTRASMSSPYPLPSKQIPAAKRQRNPVQGQSSPLVTMKKILKQAIIRQLVMCIKKSVKICPIFFLTGKKYWHLMS